MTEHENECHKCGYEWTYSGRMPEGAYVTCPACTMKTKLEVSVDTES